MALGLFKSAKCIKIMDPQNKKSLFLWTGFTYFCVFTLVAFVLRYLYSRDANDAWLWIHDGFLVKIFWQLTPVLAFILYFQQSFSWAGKYKGLLFAAVGSVVMVAFDGFFNSITNLSEVNIINVTTKFSLSFLFINVLFYWKGFKEIDTFEYLPQWIKISLFVFLCTSLAAMLSQVFGGCIWYIPQIIQGDEVYTWGRFGRQIINNDVLIFVYLFLSYLLFLLTRSFWRRYLIK